MAEAANGADKLIASILEEAHRAAEAIGERGEAKAAAIRAKLEEDMEALREEAAVKAEQLREETLSRAATASELEARKELLEKKRALIDRAYSGAMEGLSSLEGEKREALMRRLLSRECTGGESVCPAEKDRALIEKLVSECGGGLTLGECEPGIADGFILRGSNFVKDCSFAALMEEVKTGFLSETARTLFRK